MPSISVGSIRCEAGQKASGYIDAVDRADGTSFRIPVTIAAGKKDGPGGHAGTVCCSILSVHRTPPL